MPKQRHRIPGPRAPSKVPTSRQLSSQRNAALSVKDLPVGCTQQGNSVLLLPLFPTSGTTWENLLEGRLGGSVG